MSLLDDLTNLDFSAVIDARATISSSGAALSLTLDKGAALTVLGDLGTALDAIQQGVADPGQLLQPLVDRLLEVTAGLQAELPLAPWVEAMQAGVELLLELVKALSGDPAQLATLLSNQSSSDLIRRANRLVGDYSPVALTGLTQFRQLVEVVEGKLPQDPAALAELTVRVLQPFEGAPLRQLRGEVDRVLAATAQIELPRTRLTGLQLALSAVITAANTGNVAALEGALGELGRICTATLNSLRNDLAQLNVRIGQLPLAALLEPLHTASHSLQSAEEGILAFLDKWRAEIVAARTLLASTDFTQVSALINQGLDLAEATARQLFVEPIDRAVAALKGWLRNLLAHLHLVELRGSITRFLTGIAQTIEGADLDRVARAARQLLDDLGQAITGDLVGGVQAKVAELKGQIDGFLDTVIGALESITTAVNGIADQARAVLEQLIAALEQFKRTIDQLTAMVEQLGIEAATAQVIDVITALRTTAEEVLKSVALPEPLRPAIEQLIAEIEQVDLDALFAPAFQVTELNFAIPPEVSQGLETVAAALANLIPDELIQAIEAEVNELLAVVRTFDPTTLLGGVTTALTAAAAALRSLDPRPAVNAIRGPYQAVLDQLDALHPDRLLAPVIQAWDRSLQAVDLPSPQDAVRNLAGAINRAGEGLAQQAVAPIQQLAPAGTLTPRPAPGAGAVTGTGPGIGNGTGNPATPADLLPVRPGDVVRLFGYLPNQLREHVRGLEASAAQAFLTQLDGLGRGLAADLRHLPEALHGVEGRLLGTWEEMLLPLGPLHFSAQLAIEANFTGAQLDLQGSLNAVAAVRPGALRAELDELLRTTVRQIQGAVQGLTTGAGAQLDYAVSRLETNLLHELTQDLDRFLAALDPEPIAAELDQLIDTALRRAPAALTLLQDDLVAAFRRLEHIIRELNPATQAQKFLTVVEVLEEQINLLDPRRLAAELGEIHGAIKGVLLAYDPARLAEEIYAVIEALATALTALDPATLLGDLADFDLIVAKVAQAVPTTALAAIDSSLEEVGARLQALNPNGLIEAINALPGRLVEALTTAVAAIKAEIVTLLNTIKYASANASVRVEATVAVG